MNCKQGDLAIFVRSQAGNHGRIVQCLRQATAAESRAVRMDDQERFCWLIDQHVPTLLGIPSNVAFDDLLRPIRPQRNDAVDEMVQRVGPAPMTLTEILQGEVTS